MADDPKTQMKRLATLWAEAYPHLNAYVLSVVRDFHDAEDIVQQAAIRIAEHFDRYDPDRPFVPWAIAIAKHLIIDFHRKGGRVSAMFDTEVLDKIAVAHEEIREELDESRAALRHCLEQLQDRARRILDLAYSQNLSARQIAEAVGISANAVWISQSRSRAALQACIKRRLAAADNPRRPKPGDNR